MAKWPAYYILVGRIPIAVDAMTWAVEMEMVKRHKTEPDPWRIGYDQITKSCHVSTVFLGLNHNHFGKGDPILFETMVFGGPLDGEQHRYCTYDEAERGHAEMVAQARIACAKVDAIAQQAGAKEDH